MYTIALRDDPRRFPCQRGQHVLDALSPVHGERIIAGCQGGGCGVCRIAVRHGTFETATMNAVHISIEDRSAGIVLACRTFPNSDLEITVLGKRVLPPAPQFKRRL